MRPKILNSKSSIKFITDIIKKNQIIFYLIILGVLFDIILISIPYFINNINYIITLIIYPKIGLFIDFIHNYKILIIIFEPLLNILTIIINILSYFLESINSINFNIIAVIGAIQPFLALLLASKLFNNKYIEFGIPIKKLYNHINDDFIIIMFLICVLFFSFFLKLKMVAIIAITISIIKIIYLFYNLIKDNEKIEKDAESYYYRNLPNNQSVQWYFSNLLLSSCGVIEIHDNLEFVDNILNKILVNDITAFISIIYKNGINIMSWYPDNEIIIIDYYDKFNVYANAKKDNKELIITVGMISIFNSSATEDDKEIMFKKGLIGILKNMLTKSELFNVSIALFVLSEYLHDHNIDNNKYYIYFEELLDYAKDNFDSMFYCTKNLINNISMLIKTNPIYNYSDLNIHHDVNKAYIISKICNIIDS